MIVLEEDVVRAVEAEVGGLDVAEPVDVDEVRRWSARGRASTQIAQISRCVSAVLDEQGYVLIRGLSTTVGLAPFIALGTLLGDVYLDPQHDSAIFHAEVRPNAELMGNQLRRLPFHTDYSMLPIPPRYTMSLCVRSDSVASGGAVDIVDVEAATYGIEHDTMISRFFAVSLPFTARWGDAEQRVSDWPILSRKASGKGLLTRYHRSRIVQGFRASRGEAGPEEASVMRDFEAFVRPFSQRVRPMPGDILVLDNHRTLHARESCGVRLRADGTTTGREMRFLFVNEREGSLHDGT